MFDSNYLVALEPFLKFGKIFGFYPVDFKNNVQKGGLKFTCLGIMRTFIVFSILCGMIVFIVRNHITFLFERQPFLGMLIWSWFLLCMYPVIIIKFVLHIKRIKDIFKFFNHMNEIDGKLRKLFIKIDYKRHRKIIFWNTVLIVTVLVGRCIISLTFAIINRDQFVTRGSIIAQEICFSSFLFYETFFILQFLFVAYFLRERFTLIKDLLRYEKENYELES